MPLLTEDGDVLMGSLEVTDKVQDEEVDEALED